MRGTPPFMIDGTGEVTRTVFSSNVINVPAKVVVGRLKKLDGMKTYGVDGGVVGCCVMENLLQPCDIGAVRRCTLRLWPYAGKLIREKLVRYEEFRQVPEDETNMPRDDVKQVGELRAVEVTLEFVPCDSAERHRSPFDADVEATMTRASTTYVVSTVTRCPHRCFVELRTEYTMRVREERQATISEKLREREARRAVSLFWQRYLDAQLEALEKAVLKVAFPEVKSTADAEQHQAFLAHEEVLCAWAADSSDTPLSRATVVEEMEKVLVWWSRALEAYRQQRFLVDVSKQIVGTDEPAEKPSLPTNIARLVPLSTATPVLENPRSSVSRSSGTSSPCSSINPENHDSSDGAPSLSRSALEGSLTRLRPRQPPVIPVSGSASGRCTSFNAPTSSAETRRRSVQLPRDRRYTAVPKKSIASAVVVSERGPASSMMSTVSAAAPTPLAAASRSTSTAFSTSGVPVSTRRRPVNNASPHLLQLAQRRLSNLNQHDKLSNTSSQRASPINAAGLSLPFADTPGLFFSQIFRNPTHTRSKEPSTAAPGVGGAPAVTSFSFSKSSGPHSRPTSSTAASAARRVRSFGSYSAVTNATTTATAAATNTPRNRRRSLSAAPFEPQLVRRLFSLAGVLQEDVARRVFNSLCTVQDDAKPGLSAEGLRQVLACIDPCRLRGGGSLGGADVAAAAPEEAVYRAEVQRFYAAQRVAASNAVEKNVVDEAVELGRLTARREERLRATDKEALDKLVQAAMLRFACQRKPELTFEEFTVALLYLSNG